MLLRDGCAEEGILPVGAAAPTPDHLGGDACGCLLGVGGKFQVEVSPLLCVHQVEFLVHVGDAYVVSVVYLHMPLTLAAVLGGHDDDAVGSARAVDG